MTRNVQSLTKKCTNWIKAQESAGYVAPSFWKLEESPPEFNSVSITIDHPVTKSRLFSRMIRDKTSGTAYCLHFKAPIEEWDEKWEKYGNYLTSCFVYHCNRKELEPHQQVDPERFNSLKI